VDYFISEITKENLEVEIFKNLERGSTMQELRGHTT
jgi:hypothetical protein